jgi:mRNA guanylyltransferase
VFDHIIPNLKHGNDGLIFTMNACPYYPGTCQEILKWKPKNLNTIDFDVRPLDQFQRHMWGLYTFTTRKLEPTRPA